MPDEDEVLGEIWVFPRLGSDIEIIFGLGENYVTQMKPNIQFRFGQVLFITAKYGLDKNC